MMKFQTVPNTTPVAELVERLNTYGAVIIENAADEATIAEVEGALAAVEAFDQPQAGGRHARADVDGQPGEGTCRRQAGHPPTGARNRQATPRSVVVSRAPKSNSHEHSGLLRVPHGFRFDIDMPSHPHAASGSRSRSSPCLR